MYFIFECVYLPRFLNSYHDLKNEKLKPMDVLDRALPLGNLDINPKELHTPKSTPKNPKGDGGDMKKKLKLNLVFCENEAWQNDDIMFQELLKWKLVFVGKL
jgi:hypothetical protein